MSVCVCVCVCVCVSQDIRNPIPSRTVTSPKPGEILGRERFGGYKEMLTKEPESGSGWEGGSPGKGLQSCTRLLGKVPWEGLT